MFDPTYPLTHAVIESAPLRNQFNSLKALIDAVQSLTGAQIDTVNTLNPGEPAMASLTVSANVIHFSFSIPRGADGAPGANGLNGFNGQDGAPGIQGPPGEVTNAALATAIQGTSNNTNGVATLNLVVSDPPTQAEVQAVANKLDELILALRR